MSVLARCLAAGTVVLGFGIAGCGDASGPSPLQPTSIPTPATQPVPVPMPIPTPKLPAPEPKPLPGTPATPAQLAPPNGAVLSGILRVVTLKWRAVSEPPDLTYLVDLQIRRPGSKKWEPAPRDSEYYGSCAGKLRATSCITRFVEPMEARWRVTAVSADKLASPPSPWWTFRFK